MNVGVIDYVLRNFPLKKRLERISELGFEGCQLWIACIELGFKMEKGSAAWLPDYKPETRSFSKKELKRLLDKTRLQISMLGPHYVLGEHLSWLEASTGTFPSETAKKERMDDIKKLIDFAVDMEVDKVEMFSGGKPDEPEQWPELVEMMKEISDYAQDNQITICVENMGYWQMPIHSVESLIRLIRDVDSKALKICFDPKNLTQASPYIDIPRAVRTLRGLIAHTHAGDAIYGVGSVSPLGEGTIPYPEYLKALRETGFDGWLAIDAMKTEEDLIQSKKYLEDVIRILFDPKWP